ncbi:phosphoribosylglycinamide formyltransferase [Pseudomonas sp. Marseille-QA0892]
MTEPCNIVVLLSGSGSNLQALLDDIGPSDNRHPGRIKAVISNVADAYGLERARQAGIDTHTLNHRTFPDRESFDRELIRLIDTHAPDLVVLAGFMRILSGGFVSHYQGRLINIHPSLLPRHKGLDTHARAIEAGDLVHGCSVHFVTEQLDGGPVILQAEVPIQPQDTSDTLAARVLEQEHVIYPLAVRWFAERRLRLAQEGAMLDGNPLPASGITVRPISGDH